MRLPRRLLFALFATLLFPARGAAQTPVASEPIPTVPALPSSRDESPAPALINKHSLQEYRPILVPELVALVAEGQVELKAFKESRYPYAMDEEWMSASAVSTAELDERGLLVGLPPLERRFPFGTGERLAQEGDRTARGRKLLWNSSAHWAHWAAIDADVSIRSSNPGERMGELRARVRRAVPRLLRSDDKTAQIFRELIRFSAPRAIGGWSWLTFRFAGADEDIVWVYSPAIGKVRQLTGSNRSDPFLRSGVSANDLMGWSGKNESVEPAVVRELTALAPIGDIDAPSLSEEKGCLRAAFGTASPARAPSGEMRPLLSGAGPLEGIVFIPRPLLRTELAPLDPFSAVGRQIVYYDAEVMLPFIRIAYDRAGRLAKVVFNSFPIATAPGKNNRLAVPLDSVILDIPRKESFRIHPLALSFCATAPEGLTLNDFDPAQLAPAKSAATPAASAPSSPPKPTPAGEALSPPGLEVED